jgi:hypothetical protein
MNESRLPRRFELSRVLAILFLGMLLQGTGLAQLNQNCIVSVLNRNVQVSADGTWVLPNIPANFGPVRARATCVNNGITRFGQSALFTISANGSTNVPPIVLGATTPIPNSMSVSAPVTLLSVAGATTQLQVTATYAGGATQDVTAAAQGTIYTISNPAIATVSAGGLVTAVSSGTAVVQAVNEGTQGIINIQVVLAGASHGGIPDSWAIAHGLDPNDPAMPFEDPDHDGLTNLQEFLNGTDPHNPDTDGDGLTDGQEVLLYHTSPVLLSTDGTGIPDGIEVQTGTLGGSLPAKLAAALQSLEVRPGSFVLNVNTIQGQATQQLSVLGHLIDGKTTIDLTSTLEGTNYSSSDLTICNFGTPDGNIFAGSNGSCTITVSNTGFTAQATAVVRTFSPVSLSFVTIPGFANAVNVNGNFAFVAAGASGLQVVNVADRTHPAIVASLALAGNANDVKLLGNFAYVAAGSAGLHIIDVSNPLAPVRVGTLNTGSTAFDVAVRGTTAYIANGTNLFLADVTNPALPNRIASLPLNGTIQGVDVDAQRNLAVVAAGSSGVYVVNISNPVAPVRLGTVLTGDARDVAIRGNSAFVADFQNSTTSVDITTPSSPLVLSHILDPNLGGFLQDIVLSGTFALAADVKFVNGIPITDISDPTSLHARAILNFPQRDDNGMGIAADGTYVYLVTEHSSLSKFGSSGDSRLYIGQYLALVDNKGIPPVAAITSPLAGSTVIAGSRLPITVNATDDVAVAAVTFLVNGQVVFTATTAPYQFNLTVPAGNPTVTLGATAVDLGGNVGTAQNVVVNVVPDPGTTVTGVVVNTNQSPVAGATVTTGGLSAITQIDGSFSIANVPTVQGGIVVNASAVANGVSLRGSSSAVPPVPGGTTNVGTIVVSQAVFETNFGTLLSQCDDCFFPVQLPFPFTFFGVTYNSIFVNNNGNLSFNSGDSTFTPSIAGFPSRPRISPFWDDLISAGGPPNEGLYVNSSLPGRFVVTWLHEQIFCCTGDDTIQATLFNDGRIQFAYNGITTIAGSTSNGSIVGITPGGNVPLTQVDYLSRSSFSTTGAATILEQFINVTNPFNLDGGFVLFAPNASGGYDVQVIPPSAGAAGTKQPAAGAGASVTIQGTAFDTQGNPLAGVEIDVTSSLALSYRGITTTDQSGHYSISGVPLGGINVLAMVNGIAVSSGGAVVQASGTATIDLHPPVDRSKQPLSMLKSLPGPLAQWIVSGARMSL